MANTLNPSSASMPTTTPAVPGLLVQLNATEPTAVPEPHRRQHTSDHYAKTCRKATRKMPKSHPQMLGAPRDATMRQLVQRIRFAAAMRPSRHCRPLYIRSAFALLTALQV